MVFNKSWSFLKQYTIENDYQTKLPMHDPRLDYTTGWEGWDPVRAVRVQGTHRPAGEPVPQDGSNINYEEGDPRLPPAIPKIPDDNDPVWNDPNSRWSKDPISNVPYYMAGANRDGKYHPRARKLFAGLKNAKAGTWVSNNTMGDINNLYTHNAPGKLVYIRGNLDKYGKVHRRDSDEAKEDLAEAFIEHDKNIPRESLVEVPLRRHYRDQTLEMGTPNLGRNISNTDRRPSGRISRWSDKPLPWGKPIKQKQIEDMDEDEIHNLFHGKTKDEIYELTKGSPMKKAFRLLKNIQEDEDMGEGEETGLFNMNENMLYDYFNNFNPEKQDENTERLDEYGNIIDYNEQDYEDSIKEFNRYYEKRKRDNRRYYEHENKRIEPSKERFPMSLFPEDHPEYTTRFEWKNRKLASKPMDISFQLLKERKSPAAFAHKLEYDKQYQKDPKRVKYREQLNAERRKRGIYGKGGKDVSHTQGGKLTLESAHANRARHFKNKGTLRRVKVKK
jgi:hypothetical protein